MLGERQDGASKPKGNGASPKQALAVLGPAESSQLGTVVALGTGCLGARACFTSTALSVRLLWHLPRATRSLPLVQALFLSTEQDTGL